MTQENLLDALTEDLKRLFKDLSLRNSNGTEQRVNVYRQNLPVREGVDEEMNPDAPPEPYILVKLSGGEMPGNGEALTAEAVLLICVYDEAKDRQGYRDMLHIVNVIMLHYGAFSILARKYEIVYPIEWAAQDDDTHPYYFGAVGIDFEIPSIYSEVPEV